MPMFESIQPAPADPILGLTEAFRADPNPKKINLSVGVYQDASGKTPVLESIKRAAQKVVEKQASKSYLPIPGSPAYAAAVQKLMFGAEHEAVTSGRVATSHTPGGTGALRVAADLIHQQHAEGDDLDDAADLAEPSADFRRGRRADEDGALLRRQDERSRLGRVHRRREADPRRRRAAAARLLPQSDRHRPDARTVEEARRRDRRARHPAALGLRLSRLRRRPRRRRGRPARRSPSPARS